MIGTKRIFTIEKGLRINLSCRGAKANRIEITLNPLDYYDMKFYRVRAGEVKEVASEEDVFCGDMHDIIEKHTGLYTRL